MQTALHSPKESRAESGKGTTIHASHLRPFWVVLLGLLLLLVVLPHASSFVWCCVLHQVSWNFCLSLSFYSGTIMIVIVIVTLPLPEGGEGSTTPEEKATPTRSSTTPEEGGEKTAPPKWSRKNQHLFTFLYYLTFFSKKGGKRRQHHRRQNRPKGGGGGKGSSTCICFWKQRGLKKGNSIENEVDLSIWANGARSGPFFFVAVFQTLT